MKTKAERNKRNRILRKYYGQNFCLEYLTEKEKDDLFDKISVNCISSFHSTNELPNYVKYVDETIPDKENIGMNTTTFESERRALTDLSYSIERDKTKQARKTFHIDLYRPSTYGELRKLIKDQKIDLHPNFSEFEDDEEICDYTSPISMLTLNYQKPDNKGYKEVAEKIEKEAIKLRTHIKIFPPEESFKKLEEFEKKSFH